VDLIVFEQDRPFIIQSLRSGEFDYIEAANEVAEADFFRDLFKRKVIADLAESYPTPRQKEEVPLWLYVSSEISLKLHGANSHYSYPHIIRCGGLLEALGPALARKTTDKKTGDVGLSCEGFNHKNHYQRETPCDQDFLRKLARQTEPDRFHQWFNQEVPRCLKKLKLFDPEGLFIGDGTYLFVPDNEAYEGSVVLLFDDHNHPVDPQKVDLTDKRYHWERCYKMVSIIHTNRALDYFLYVAVKLVSGKTHECPVLYELVEDFVKTMGRGIMKVLILDRGFIDGPSIGKCKKEYGVDVIMPLRKNMDLYKDAVGLTRAPDFVWERYEEPVAESPPAVVRPPAIEKREAARQRTLALRKGQRIRSDVEPAKRVQSRLASFVGTLEKAYTWRECPVPLNAVINREINDEGKEDFWVLVTTRLWKQSRDVRTLYGLRPAIEERHRQIKCFWDLTDFKSCSFALVLNQVIFLALTYTLLQAHLYLRRRAELNRLTRPRLLQMLTPTVSVIIVYYQRRFARLTIGEYSQILLTVEGEAKQKLLARIRRLKDGVEPNLLNPRPPP
jgi:Transposase DDE domain